MTSQRAGRFERRERALAARAAQTPVAPAPEHLRVATWNVNSIRSRLPALERFVDRTEPDIVCLQETRVRDLPDDAVAMLTRRGYQAAHAGTAATTVSRSSRDVTSATSRRPAASETSISTAKRDS